MADESDEWEPTWLWFFILGALVFLAGLGVFVYQLWQGTDVIAGIAVNGIGAVLLIVWAAKDALSDPSIEGATWSVAAGTGLVLYGLYLLGAGIVVAATGVFVHDRLTLGLLYIPLALVAVIIGFAIHRAQVEITLDEDDEGSEDDSDADAGEESG
jgi:hypothetical protein